MAEKIKISDLFDFSDVQDLEELYRRLEQINKIYKKLATDIGQESKTIQTGINGTEKAVKELSDALKVASDDADIKKLSDAIEKQAAANKKLTAQNEKLVEQNKKLKESQKEVNEEGKEAERLLKEQEKLKAKISKATGEEAKQNAILKLELQRVNKETKEQAKQAAGLENAYQKLVRETREAKNEAKKLGAQLIRTNKQFGEGSKEALELGRKFDIAAKKADGLDKELKDLDASVGDFQRNVGNYESALDGIGQGFSSVLELATPVGLAIAAVGLAIEGIGALAETVQETNQQLKETAQLTGLSGDQLATFTGQVRTTAKVFDQEYKEVLRSSNALAKEFGIEGSEAIKLINSGFIQGANINDDYLDQLREYAPQFKAAGLSAQDFNNVVALGAKEGIFNDKAADTVKEAGLRLREFTKATEDSLQPLGKATNEQIKQAVAAGESFKAIQLVSQGLKDTALTAQQTQSIITNTFGGPGEDAGLRFIQLLSGIETGQDAINASLTEQQKKQLEILAVEEKLAAAEVKLGEAFKNSGQEIGIFFTQLQTLGIEAIVSVIDDVKEGFDELTPLFNEAKQLITELAESLGLGGDGLTDFLKKFNPVTLAIEQGIFFWKIFLNTIIFVVDILKTTVDITKQVGNALIDFATSFSPVNDIVEGFTMLFKDLFAVFSQAPQFLSGLQAAFFETFKQIRELFTNTVEVIKLGIEGAFRLDLAKVKQAIALSGQGVTNAGKEIALAFQKGFDETAPITTAVKTDTQNAVKELEKSNKQIAAKTTEQKKKDKDTKDKAFQQELKTINDENAQKESLLKQQRTDQLISEQEFQDELLILKLERLEAEKALLESEGKDTIAVQKQIDDLLLNEQKKSEKAGIEQQKKANKESERIDKEEAARKKKQEEEERQDRADRANDPIVQAGLDGLQSRVENEAALAGIVAFRASLENGDDLQTALSNGGKAVAAAKVYEIAAKGFHDGGYTGDGGEYDAAGIVHKGEFVNTKKQTTKYNMRGWSAQDFDNAVDNGYFNQFADVNNATAEQLNVNPNIIVNNDSKQIVDKIEWLASQFPKEQLKEVGGVIQHTVSQGQTTKTTKFKVR